MERLFAAMPYSEGNQMRPVPGLEMGAPEVRITPNQVLLGDNGLNALELGLTVDAFNDGLRVDEITIGGERFDLILTGQEHGVGQTQDIGSLPVVTRDGIVLALSTTGLNDTALPELSATRPVSLVGEGGLPPLYAAAAQACEEAVLNGLLQAVPLPDRGAVAFGSAAPRQSGHLSRTLPIGGWPQEVRRFQSARRRRGG